MGFTDEMRLYDTSGNRLYINEIEREHFLTATKLTDSAEHRLFCEVLFWSGCRLMEAAALTPSNIQIENNAIVFKTLKRRKFDTRGKERKPVYRAVPVPTELIESLDLVFQIRRKQKQGRASLYLWPNARDKNKTMSRATAWRIVKRVMDAAHITGAQATAKGLRHSFGVSMTLAGMDVFILRDRLGHVSAETTQVYRQAVGKDDFELQMSYWKYHK